MATKIGIRREDKSVWERRVPIVPEDARELMEEHDVEIVVQPSPIRIFRDEEYVAVGARVQEDLSDCDVVLAIKEIPPHLLPSGKVCVFFAHVIKGQPYNMPMLKQLLDQACVLVDYEKVTDENDRRLIFFGRHAGQAGMLDTFWALGQRLRWEGIPNPFDALKQAHQYPDLETAEQAVLRAGARLRREGLAADLVPLVVGFAGYGRVSTGAQEVFDLLPSEEVAPGDLAGLEQREADPRIVYKVVFKEEHLVEPVSSQDRFELQDYYGHPQKYRSRFSSYVPYLTVLVNGIYWEAKYPRLLTKDYLRALFTGPERPRLRVIGDISCDVEGAVECTVKCTEPGDPVYVYDPLSGEITDGYSGDGVVVLAVDILPSELPRESSIDFSAVLKEFVPAIAQADFSVPFEELALPPEIRRAVIAYRGELTPDYRYLEEYLRGL